jgi:multidrug efflux system membrane fusion protein
MSIDLETVAPKTKVLASGVPGARRPSRRSLIVAAGVAIGLAAVIVVIGLFGRAREATRTEAWTNTQSIPVVSLVSPTPRAGGETLVLPGNLQAYYNAPIYSRVSGYVHAWYQDIGARVRAGQLLATIDTPELDQQLIQARANLASAQADMQLAGTTEQRWVKLLAQDAVSKQETDEKTGDLAVKTARVNSARADVDRLLALKGFSRIVAPFDGVVTARRTDVGALINAGSGASTTTELFDVAKVDQLRLYVSVPQSDSALMRTGVTATLSVPEFPGRTFPATLTTTANAVSDRTGTLLVELLVNNAGQVLKAGDYAEVKFNTSSAAATSTLLVPSSALLFRKSGMEAAVVGDKETVHLRPVKVGRDLGGVIEVIAGLSPSDRVVDNPPDSLAEGQLVRVVHPVPARHHGGVGGTD